MNRLLRLAPAIALAAATPWLSHARPRSAPSDGEATRPPAWIKPPKAARTAGRSRLLRLVHQDEHGRIPHDAIMRAKAELAALPAVGAAGGLDSTKWTEVGPGNIGGRIRAILIHPTQTNTVFVGSVTGGIWKSVNAGASWKRVDDLMGNLAISSLVMDPRNPAILYAGTGEGYLIGGEHRGAGIFKSTDGGTKWTRLASTNTGDFYFVNRLTISPDGKVLLAGTSTGIYRSTDGGATWLRRGPSSADFGIYDIRFHPQKSNVAVATYQDWNSNAQTYFTSGAYSIDGGLNWRGSTGLRVDRSDRLELAWHKGWTGAGNGCIYVQANRKDSNDRPVTMLYRSVDGGANFTRVVSDGAGVLGTQGDYDNVIWIDPSDRDANVDNDMIIAGGVQMWRSTNGGRNFRQITDWRKSDTLHPDHHGIVEHPGFDGATNKQVYFANDGGIYRANDVYKDSWVNLNNDLGITQFYGASRHAGSNIVYGGTQDNGILATNSTKGYGGWTTANGGDGGFSASDATDPRYHYNEYVHGRVSRSVDRGESASDIWGMDQATSQLKSPPYLIPEARDWMGNFIAPIVLDPNDPNRLFVGLMSLWRSNDCRAPNTRTTGPRWSVIKSPHGNDPWRDPISAIAVVAGDADQVWIGHNDGSIYLSTNATATNPNWTRMDGSSLPNRYVTRLVLDEKDANHVYALFGGFTANNIWETKDRGRTWTALASFPRIPVRDLEIHPSKRNWLYAATEVGLLVSEDAGKSWSAAAAGSDVSIHETFFSEKRLYLATHGRGVFYQEPDDGDKLPDLEIVSVTNPPGSTWKAATGYQTQITFRNNGSVASPRTLFAFFLSRDATIDSSQDDVLETRAVPSIGPNGTTTMSDVFTTSACLNGTGNWYIGVAVDPLQQLRESNEANNTKLVGQARALERYKGTQRLIGYLNPRVGNSDGPAWRGYAAWPASKGMRAQICAVAPSRPGSFVVLFMSASRNVQIDPWTTLSLNVPLFPPVLVRTSTTTGRGTVQQVMPPFPTTETLTAYIHSAWLTPVSVQFYGFGHNSITNVMSK